MRIDTQNIVGQQLPQALFILKVSRGDVAAPEQAIAIDDAVVVRSAAIVANGIGGAYHIPQAITQKTGKGFYCYAPGSRRPEPNPALMPLLEAVSRDKGITRDDLSDQYIVERCIFALINEGAKILEEGIVRRSGDIDVIYLHGYGFAAWRGGPMFYADSLGLDKVLARIREFHQRFGAWWQPAPLLEKLAAQGGRFADWKPAS